MRRIPIWISNRHIHLCQIDADKLFGKNYEFKKKKELSQTGEYACEETLDIVWPRWTIEHVRVLLPLRKFTQVEIMRWDSFFLGVDSVLRVSWKLEWTPWITLRGPIGLVDIIFGLIVAKRHLHCTVKEAQEMWIVSGQDVKIKVWGERWLIFDNVEVRAKDNYTLDFHIDIEEANAAWLNVWDRWEIV